MNIGSILLIGGLITGSLGASAYAMTNNQSTAGQTNETSKTISEIKAKEIALAESKGGLVTKSQVEEENGTKKYEMTITNQNKEFKVDINASTGKVLKSEQEIQDEDEHDDALQGVSPKVSLENAKKTALDKVKGSITKAKLDNDDNQLVYELEISTADYREADIKVDATNGKVLSVEFDD